MKDYKNERSLSTVAALLLLAVFAVGVLAVLLSGAQSYRRLTQQDQIAFDSRTVAQYLASKLRQAPGPEAASISDFGGTAALQIIQQIDGEEYVTHIYCHDGWLMELFSIAQGDFSPEDGEKVLPASDLRITRQQDLLTVELLDGSGEPVCLKLSIRGWEDVPQ